MASGRIVINQERCKGCGLCIWACPPGVIEISEHHNALGYRPAYLHDPKSLCTGCGLCAVMCPDAVITVYRTVPVKRTQQVLAEAL